MSPSHLQQPQDDPFEDFAELYEITHKNKDDDLALYLEYANHANSTILEIGCGTGRVSFALAAAGRSVFGIDYSENMLKIAREKLQEADEAIRSSVQFERQDMAQMDLPGRLFNLALMPYGEFAHILERPRQDATLAAIYDHLNSDGRLIIGMSNWDPREVRTSYHGGEIARWGSNMPVRYEGTFEDSQRQRTITRYIARGYDPSVQIAIHVYIHEIADNNGVLIAKKTNILPIRYVFRHEMEMLLEKAGFQVEALFGSYDKQPFVHDSKRMIFVARKP